MAEWTEPKIDWEVATDEDGNYQGDFFNVSDYNRIKNNLLYLRELANRIYPPATRIEDLGEDKAEAVAGEPLTESNVYFADEFNAIEDCLEALKEQSQDLRIGDKMTFSDNGLFIGPDELNRIERAELNYYNFLMKAGTDGRRTAFRAGINRFVNT